MKRHSKTNQHRITFEKLEPRQLLASTLYVDFGFGAGDSFDVSDATVAPLNGPQVFGANYSLESFSDNLIDRRIVDRNNDGVVDQTDVQIYTDFVMDQLSDLFAPFDVTVSSANATGISDITASLGSSTTNDAYVFVGGSRPTLVYEPSQGAAVSDSGNTSDNLAFAFSESMISDSLNNHLRRLTATIAQQAGVSWGLELVEQSNQLAADDVMALPGTDINGEVLPDNQPRYTYSQKMFTRANMETIRTDGVSAGSQSSFDALAAIVGRSDSIEYFTTTGLDDSIVVTQVAPNLVDILINEASIPSVDSTNGIKFLGNGERTDQITFGGDSIHLEVDGYEGTANTNIAYKNIWDVRTGDFADQIDINDFDISVSIPGIIRAGGGNDTITWQANVAGPEGPQFNVGTIYGDAGDDELIFLTPQRLSEFDGGAGFDRVDLSATESTTQSLFASKDTGIELGFFDIDRGNQGLANVEHIVGSDTGTSTIRYGYMDCFTHFCNSSAPISSDYVIAEIDGDLTTVFDQEHEVPIVFENFDSAVGNEVNVLSLNRDMEVNADKVQLSSNPDFTQGTTTGFNGNLKVTDASLFVISNKNGDATGAITMYEASSPEAFIIEGMTDGRLDIDATRIVVHGSDNAGDRFQVSSAYRELFIQGHGGDDLFLFSWSDGTGRGNLEHLTKTPHVFAGEGSDWLYASDYYEGGDLVRNHSYLLNENWVTNSEDQRGSGERYFKGIYHRDLEKVRVNGSPDANIFRVNPSTKVSYNVDGGEGDGIDTLMLVGNVPEPERRNFVHREGNGTGTWWFASDGSTDNLKSILFSEMEKVAGVERLAIGSQAGPNGSPLVRVFDPLKNRFLFDINPYTANFKGGVQVATGDLNGDAVPDIVIAPGKGRYSLVLAFDGLNGKLLKTFFAFAAPYNKGVDVAVGNVQGDTRNEIIVSTLNDDMKVKVFADSAAEPLNYQSTFEYSPYTEGTPKVGVRIETADMNWDGVEDIIAVPGPGWIPQVAIHSVVDESAVQVNRFLAYVQSYQGGLNVAVGNLVGNRKPELIIGAGITQRADNPFSGQFRIFQGERMPKDAGFYMPTPIYSIEAYSGTQQVSVQSMDMDMDGRIDRIFTGSIGGENDINRRVNIYRVDGQPTLMATIPVQNANLQHGITLG